MIRWNAYIDHSDCTASRKLRGLFSGTFLSVSIMFW